MGVAEAVGVDAPFDAGLCAFFFSRPELPLDGAGKGLTPQVRARRVVLQPGFSSFAARSVEQMGALGRSAFDSAPGGHGRLLPTLAYLFGPWVMRSAYRPLTWA